MNGRIAIILGAVVVVTTVCFATGPAAFAQQVSEAQKLAMRTKPSVVRIYDGYEGELVWMKSGKVYQVAAYGFGSGSFINPNRVHPYECACGGGRESGRGEGQGDAL